MSHLLIILFLILLPVFLFAQDGEWSAVNNGLENLNVNALALHPDDENVLYAGTNDGFYRSDNGGENWQHTRMLAVNSIWVSPDGRMILVACGAGSRSDGIWISQDNGNNFGVFTWIRWASAITVNPTNNQQIFCGSSQAGFLYSLDGGNNWQEENNGLPSNCINHLCSKSIDGTTYIFASTDRGFARFQIQENNQIQWDDQQGLPVCQTAFSCDEDQVVYQGTGDVTDSDALYRSDNLGDDWDVSIWAHRVQAVETTPGLVVMASTEIGVNRSANGGEEWIEMNEELRTFDFSDLAIRTFENQNIIYGATNGSGILTYTLPIEEELKDLTVSMSEGWNLISINITPLEEMWEVERGPDVILMMEQLRIGEDNHHLEIMKNGIGQFYNPEWNFNNIRYWDLTQGYQVKVDEDLETVWSGIPIAANSDILLNAGWNIISYFPEYDLDASAPDFYVVSPILEHVLRAKDAQGRFMTPAFNFSNMEPWCETQGYQIKVNQDVVFSYPEEDQE